MKRICVYAIGIIILACTTMAIERDLVVVDSYAKGFATTADEMGLEGIYKNPASMHLDRFALNSSYSTYFNSSVNSYGVSLGFPIFDAISIGFSIPIQVIDNIPNSVDSGNGTGVITDHFSSYEGEGIVSISTGLLDNRVRIGSNIRYLYNNINTNTGTGLAVDVGLLIKHPVWQFGIAMENIGKQFLEWDTGRTETIRQRYHAGIAFTIPLLQKLLIDTTLEENKTSISNVGIEIILFDSLSLKGGLRHIEMFNTRPQYSLGSSLLLDGLNVHYAFAQDEDLGQIHKAGITLEY